MGKVEDVADRGGAERIDRLGVVAHDGQPTALRAETLEQPRLQAVRVLILIDQHAIEAVADRRPGLLVLQQFAPLHQQVVVVEHVQIAFPIAVTGKQFRERFGVFLLRWELLLETRVERKLGVHHVTVN